MINDINFLESGLSENFSKELNSVPQELVMSENLLGFLNKYSRPEQVVAKKIAKGIKKKKDEEDYVNKAIHAHKESAITEAVITEGIIQYIKNIGDKFKERRMDKLKVYHQPKVSSYTWAKKIAAEANKRVHALGDEYRFVNITATVDDVYSCLNVLKLDTVATLKLKDAEEVDPIDIEHQIKKAALEVDKILFKIYDDFKLEQNRVNVTYLKEYEFTYPGAVYYLVFAKGYYVRPDGKIVYESVSDNDILSYIYESRQEETHGANVTHDIKEVEDTENYLQPSDIENNVINHDDNVTDVMDKISDVEYGSIFGGLNDDSLMYAGAMDTYLKSMIDSETRINDILHHLVNESTVIHEDARIQDSVKERWQRFVDFNNRIDDRFFESMNKLIVSQHDYLEKYEDIIKNKKPKENITYEYTGDYIEAVDRCMNTPIPVFNYERDADWLRQEGYQGAIKDFMSGKNFSYNKDKDLPQQFKAWFLAAERGTSKGSLANMNMENLFNFCYNWKDIEGVVRKDQQLLEQSLNQFINAVNKLLRDRGESINQNTVDNPQQNTTQNTGTPTANAKNTQKMGESAIWMEADQNNSNDKNASKGTTGLTLDTNAGTEKDDNGNTVEKDVTSQGKSNTAYQDITNIQVKWVNMSKAMLTAKKTIMQQIARDYMKMIKAHVRSYSAEAEKVDNANPEATKNNGANINTESLINRILSRADTTMNNMLALQEMNQEFVDSIDESIENYFNEEDDILGYGGYFQEGVVDDVKAIVKDTYKKEVDINALKKEWAEKTKNFVSHRWTYRYLKDDKQKQMVKNYFDILCKEDVSYGEYKRAFNFICQFMGLQKDSVILENIEFKKDKYDKDQEVVAIRYSKGLIKVKIPDTASLIHMSPVDNITELIPSFRSKIKGRFLYPCKRVYFSLAKNINPKKAGLEKSKTIKYTTKNKFSYAYIDPACSKYKYGAAVYIATDQPIPVEKFEKKMIKLFGYAEESKKKQKEDNNKEVRDSNNKIDKSREGSK